MITFFFVSRTIASLFLLVVTVAASRHKRQVRSDPSIYLAPTCPVRRWRPSRRRRAASSSCLGRELDSRSLHQRLDLAVFKSQTLNDKRGRSGQNRIEF